MCVSVRACVRACVAVCLSPSLPLSLSLCIWEGRGRQHKSILERKLPENLKLAIARQIENNLFAKVEGRLLP